jgi:hypothetical protein
VSAPDRTLEAFFAQRGFAIRFHTADGMVWADLHGVDCGRCVAPRYGRGEASETRPPAPSGAGAPSRQTMPEPPTLDGRNDLEQFLAAHRRR